MCVVGHDDAAEEHRHYAWGEVCVCVCVCVCMCVCVCVCVPRVMCEH